METDIAIETFIDLLKQGKSVIHTAEGYSMFPTLKPGDKILVRPREKNEIPENGAVVVCIEYSAGAQRHKSITGDERQGKNSGLVMHRLIEIRQDDSGNTFFITRGDSMSANELPWNPGQVIGLADSFYRRGRFKKISVKSPHEFNYIVNRRLLSLIMIFIKITGNNTKISSLSSSSSP